MMKLNYFPIEINFEKYQVNQEEYSTDRLAELREQHNSTHSFFRNEDFIYISNKDGNDSIDLGKTVEKSTYDDSQITASLIKHLFFRTFKDRFANYIPVDFYPFRFFSAQSKDDIIYNALPDELKNVICYKKLIELQLRRTEIDGKSKFGFIINIKRNWIFNKSCAQLHVEGYQLIGLDVLHSETLPGLDNVLAPNEEFIGVIEQINNGKASVTTNDGTKDFPLNELFVKKNKFNIGNYLTFATSKQKSDEILGIIESKRSEIYHPKNMFNEILNIAKHLFTENKNPILFQNKDGFCFTVCHDPIDVSNTMALKTPTFIYDPAGTKTNSSNPDAGLSNYGPYDSTIFDIKKPVVLCICNGSNRGGFTNFLSSLKDGIPDSRYFRACLGIIFCGSDEFVAA